MITLTDELKSLLINLAYAPTQPLNQSVWTINDLEKYLMQIYPDYSEVYDSTNETTKESITSDIDKHFNCEKDSIYLYYCISLIGMITSMCIDSLKSEHNEDGEMYLDSIVWAIQSFRTVVDYLQEQCEVSLEDTVF